MKALKKLFFIFFSFSVHLSFASPLFKPFTSLFVVETEHLHIIYDEDSNNAVSRLVSSGDTVYSQVAELIGYSSQKKVPVVVTSDVELVNAYYMAFPKSKIVLYNSPMSESSLLVFSDPIVSIFRHELTHYIVAESRSPFLEKLSNIFGSYFSITLGFNLPTFLSEGISVYSESQNGEGRLYDPFYLSEIYQAQYENIISDKKNKFPIWEEISGARTDYNTGNLPYLYGSNFVNFLVKTQETSILNLVDSAKNFHITFTNGTIKKATNKSMNEMWSEFSASFDTTCFENFEEIPENQKLNLFKKYKINKPSFQSVAKNPSSKDIDFFCIESSTGSLFRITKKDSFIIKKIKKINSSYSSMSFSPDGRFLAITELVSSGRFYNWETKILDVQKEVFLDLEIPSMQYCSIVSTDFTNNNFEIIGTYSHDTKTFLRKFKVSFLNQIDKNFSSKNKELKENSCILENEIILPSDIELISFVSSSGNRVFAILVNGVKRSIVEIDDLFFLNINSSSQDFAIKTLFECSQGQSLKDLQIVSFEPLVLSASLAKTTYNINNEENFDNSKEPSVKYIEVGFLTLNLDDKNVCVLKNSVSGGIRYPMVFNDALVFFNSQLSFSDFIYKDNFLNNFTFVSQPCVFKTTTEYLVYNDDSSFINKLNFGDERVASDEIAYTDKTASFDDNVFNNDEFVEKKYNAFLEAFPGSLIPVPLISSTSSDMWYKFIEPGFYYIVQDPASLWSGTFTCHYNFPLNFLRQTHKLDFSFLPFDFSLSFSDEPILSDTSNFVQRKTQGLVSFGDTWYFNSSLWRFISKVSFLEAGYTTPTTLANLDSLYQAPYELAKTATAAYFGFSNLRRKGTGFWDKEGITFSLLGQMDFLNHKGVFFEPDWSSQILVEQKFSNLLPKSIFSVPSWLTLYLPSKINLSAAITTDYFTPKESNSYWNHKMSDTDYCPDSKYNAINGNLVFSSYAEILLAGFDIQKPIPCFYLNTISLTGLAQECCFINTESSKEYNFLERLGLNLEISIGEVLGYATGYSLTINCLDEYFPRSKKNYFSIFGMYIF